MIIAHPRYFFKSARDISYRPGSPAVLSYVPDSRHKRTSVSDSCAGHCHAVCNKLRSESAQARCRIEKKKRRSYRTADSIPAFAASPKPVKRILIYYKPEYIDIAIKLRDNYLTHDQEIVDIISENEQDDIEYARSLQYDEAIFIEDKETVIIHDIRSWYMEKLSVSDVLYK